MQRDFHAWLQHGAQPDFGAHAEAGLDVYQNNYRAQLAACLEASFPHTLRWIGDEAFHAAIVAHVERVPPSSWTLDAYARDFPATLALVHPDDPEIFELARLEQALDEAFVGANAETVSPATIAAADWDRAVFRFVPTIDVLPAITNADDIWTALAADDVPPPATSLDEELALLVWRQGLVARFRRIDAGERGALLHARAGMPFAALCATIVAAYGTADGVTTVGQWLGRWLADGLMADILRSE